MTNTLSVPRSEFNGQAACPFIKRYRDKIKIKIVEQAVKQPIIEHAHEFLISYDKAWVLAFPRKPPFHVIESACEHVLNQPSFVNLHLLTLNHRWTGEFKGVYTGFKHCDLVIMQTQRLLNLGRMELKSKGYYK